MATVLTHPSFTHRLYTRATMMRRFLLRSVLMVLLWRALPADARVVRVEVLSRSDVMKGQPFGEAGPYEVVNARVYFAVRPGDPHNRGIVDIDKAPRNAQGEVEFSSDLFLVQPKNGHNANGTMLLEVPNRGGKHLLALVDGNDGASDPATGLALGDGWLLRHGYTVAALGWQWDVTRGQGNLRLYAPVAHDGTKSITGLLRDDFTPSHVMGEVPLGHLIVGTIGGTEYLPAAPDDPTATLTVRDEQMAPRKTIPRSEWSFGADDSSVQLRSGFQPGKLYELVYSVKDPVVAGLGFLAVRDFVSWVKHDPRAVSIAQRVYGQGVSQTGRWLRDFVYEGFNTDEQDRIVFDGVLAHVAGAGRGDFNYRFAQPSRDSQPMSSVFWPTDLFPFTDLPEKHTPAGGPEPEGEKTAGLLDAATAEHAVPKIFYSCTSYEYWGRAMSLTHTSADSEHDAPIPANTRIYYFAGLQHFSGPFPPAHGTGDIKGQQPESPLPIRWFWRAMITNMDAWVRSGSPPPPSSYPHVADGTLVGREKLTFPVLSGVHMPGEPQVAWDLLFGPDWQRTRILSMQPPKVTATYTTLVPQVDRDGNEIAGVHLPELAVPLATYTGWNLRDPSIGAAQERAAFIGSYLPFPKTGEARRAAGDPRLSIAERYASGDEYLSRYRNAAEALVAQHRLLQEDLPAVMSRGKEEWDYATR